MLFAPLFGYLGDRFNRKSILMFGLALWSAATLVGRDGLKKLCILSILLFVYLNTFCSISKDEKFKHEHSSLMFLSKKINVSLSGSSFMKSFWWFLALRAFVGIGEASYSTIAPAIISDLYSKDQVWTGDVCSLAQLDQLSNLDSRISPNAHKRWSADTFDVSTEIEGIGNFLLRHSRRHRLGVHCGLGSGRKCLGLEVGAESHPRHRCRGFACGTVPHGGARSDSMKNSILWHELKNYKWIKWCKNISFLLLTFNDIDIPLGLLRLDKWIHKTFAARGASEGNCLRPTSFKEDLIALVRNTSFVFATLAFTCVAFSAGMFWYQVMAFKLVDRGLVALKWSISVVRRVGTNTISNTNQF